MCVIPGDGALRPEHGGASPTTLSFTGLLRIDQGFNDNLFTDSYEVNGETPLGIPKKYIASIVGPSTRSKEAESWQLTDCQNIGWKDRVGLSLCSRGVATYWWLRWVREKAIWGFKDFDQTHCFGRNLFTTIFSAAYYSGITGCGNQMCEERKKALEAAAPECAWSPFRHFILTCLACKVDTKGWSFFQDIILPTEIDGISRMHITGWKTRQEIPTSFCIDIRGILDLCRWSAWIAGDMSDTRDIGIIPSTSRLGLKPSLKIWLAVLPEYENDSLAILKTCREKGLCPNRLWNVSFHGPNTSVGVCLLEKASRKISRLNSKNDHIYCSAQHCLHAHDDSTGVEQAHKCGKTRCESEISFSEDKLDQASRCSNRENWFNTAWSLQSCGEEPRVMGPDENEYMAISHVWSDGTGVGLKSFGRVNQCLYEYFAQIARRLGCHGLWWDTISIPPERAARATAIKNMLENFKRAKVTLVHDEELVNFPWSNDGSPAIALVLSSWFTRGWTAAELFASRSHDVKVLFADPDNLTGDPLIKDLDRDVFMGNGMDSSISNLAGAIPMQGYMVAADAMRRIRDPASNRGAIKKLSDLVNILSHRTTSWARDHMLIAGLMCETLNIRSDHSELEITKLILSRLARIDIPDLFHAEVPAATYGGWSWCPQSIYSLGQLYHSSSYVDMRCRVFPDGRLTGSFQVYEVLEDDELAPCGSHPALKARISGALSDRKSCLLLSTPHNEQDRLYILAQPVYMNGLTISCRWIACVRLQSPVDPEYLSGRRRDIPLCMRAYIRFGNDVSRSGSPLPPMSFDDLSLAAKSFRTYCVYRGDRTLCEDDNPKKRKDPRNWCPQLIYFYDFHTDHHQRIKNSEYNFSPSRPSARLAWDADNQENSIRESFLGILKSLVHVSEMDNDRVTLLWSFPHKEIQCDSSELKFSIFQTQFKRVPRILIKGEEHDISLGWETCDRSIRKLLKRRGNRTVIWSCKPCKDPKCIDKWGGYDYHGGDIDLDSNGEAPRQEDAIYQLGFRKG
ncbi:hypothetical protein F4679DRAFT_479861 [Xylaria curta]|nr:hypothetical protein F4679DRAFT_479861 [Xylaria curta]